MIRHIVMWKIRPEYKEKFLPEMKSRIESLKTEISEIIELEAGINSIEQDAAYDIALFSTFASFNDLEKYQKHQAHHNVVQFIRTISMDRKVVDYQV